MSGCAGCGIEEQGIGWPDADAFLCRECAGPFEDGSGDEHPGDLGRLSNMERTEADLPTGAAVVIRAHDGRFWVNQRSGTESHKGCWQIPGGGVNIGETFFAAAKRELKEEAGLDLLDHRFMLMGRSKAVKGTARHPVVYKTWWFYVDLAHNERPEHIEKHLATPWELKTLRDLIGPLMPRMHEVLQLAEAIKRVDPDLLGLPASVLQHYMMDLRNAVRGDRDVTGHNHCWFRPESNCLKVTTSRRFRTPCRRGPSS
jgi:8-oxo-dGTP diphosphatase